MTYKCVVRRNPKSLSLFESSSDIAELPKKFRVIIVKESDAFLSCIKKIATILLRRDEDIEQFLVNDAEGTLLFIIPFIFYARKLIILNGYFLAEISVCVTEDRCKTFCFRFIQIVSIDVSLYQIDKRDSVLPDVSFDSLLNLLLFAGSFDAPFDRASGKHGLEILPNRFS